VTHTGDQFRDTPDGTAAAIVALAEADPKAFRGTIASDEALYGAAAQHYRANPLWLDALGEALRQAGVAAGVLKHFQTTVAQLSRQQDHANRMSTGLRVIAENEPPPLVRTALGDDAPVPEEAVVPAGYQLNRMGIATEGQHSLVPVASRAIVISGALVDQSSGMERFVLSWWDGRAWRRRVVDRGVALNRTKITQEANYGLRVDSESAGATVRYLSAYEDANDVVTPRLTTTSHLGWQERAGDGEASFLWGNYVLRAGGAAGIPSEPAMDILHPETWHPDALVFHAKSDGDTQIAGAFMPVGTFDAWREAIAPLAHYPVPRFALYGSLSAAVLCILGAAPFIVDICGSTSQGKTTTLEAGASVWGNPDPKATASLIATWNNTGNYVEQVARMLNGLPIFLDDTSQGNPRDIPKIVYMLANGRGRGRMHKDGGTQEVGALATVTLSTGETPLVSYSQDGGTRARVLTLWGPPFGRTDTTTGQVVSELRAQLRANYGHAGPKFVRYLLEHQDQWEQWRQLYREFVAEYMAGTDGSPVANRLAEHAAVVRLTAVLAHKTDLLPWAYTDPVDPVWPLLLQGASDADRAADALRLIHSWAVEHQTQFEGQFLEHSQGAEIIPLSILGRWEMNGEHIAFSQGPLKKRLEDAGFFVDGVLRTWGDRGWLELGKDREATTLTKVTRIRGTPTRCYIVPLDAFVEVGAADQDEVDFRAGRLDYGGTSTPAPAALGYQTSRLEGV
jgi:hypothetical protein